MRSLIVAVLVPCLICAAAFAIQTSHAQTKQSAAAPSSWEYKVVEVAKMIGGVHETKDDITASVEKYLNTLGNHGWELCQEVNGAMIFKRKK